MCQAPKPATCHQDTYSWVVHLSVEIAFQAWICQHKLSLPSSFGFQDRLALPQLMLCWLQTIYTPHGSLAKGMHSMATTEWSNKPRHSELCSTPQTQPLSCFLSICPTSVFPQFRFQKPCFQAQIPGPASPIPASNWDKLGQSERVGCGSLGLKQCLRLHQSIRKGGEGMSGQRGGE